MYLFLERGEKEGEKHQCVVASQAPPPGDLAVNPSTCPDWELNQGPLSSQAGTQSTEPHQPGQDIESFMVRIGPYISYAIFLKVFEKILEVKKKLQLLWR